MKQQIWDSGTGSVNSILLLISTIFTVIKAWWFGGLSGSRGLSLIKRSFFFFFKWAVTALTENEQAIRQLRRNNHPLIGRSQSQLRSISYFFPAEHSRN